MSLEALREGKKIIEYNLAQFLFMLCKQLFIVLEWGRGAGKSTIISERIDNCVHQMPRSTGVIPAETYMQIKTRTLPSTIAGLEQRGYFKGIHFFVGEKPPKRWNWPEPYEAPIDYKHSIIWYNGTVINFVSQDGGAASGRGMNVDWIVADEAARLNKTWFDTDILLTNRGNLKRWAIYPDGSKRRFEDCPLHHSVLLVTSTPVTLEGKWILDYEKLAKQYPKKYAFIPASARVNEKNLGEAYFETAKATMLDFMYRAEVLNIRIGQIADGFYPKLNESLHCYTAHKKEYVDTLPIGGKPTCEGDGDLDYNKPLIAGIDWGARINCMVIAQAEANQFKFLKNLFVKYPSIIDDLIADFIVYYEPFRKVNNVIHLFYDPTGNVAQANSRITNADLVKKILTNAGWECSLMTRGQYNVPHEQKYTLWNELLKGTRMDLPKVTFNKSNCLELWISMTNAPARVGSTEAIKKDKRSETSKTLLQEHATHLSDAADVIVVGMFGNKVAPPQALPAPQIR